MWTVPNKIFFRLRPFVSFQAWEKCRVQLSPVKKPRRASNQLKHWLCPCFTMINPLVMIALVSESPTAVSQSINRCIAIQSHHIFIHIVELLEGASVQQIEKAVDRIGTHYYSSSIDRYALTIDTFSMSGKKEVVSLRFICQRLSTRCFFTSPIIHSFPRPFTSTRSDGSRNRYDHL